MEIDDLRNLFLGLTPESRKEEAVFAMADDSFKPFYDKLISFRDDMHLSNGEIAAMITSLGWADFKVELAIFEDLGEWRLGEEE